MIDQESEIRIAELIEQLDLILCDRDRNFPQRDPVSDERLETCQKVFIERINESADSCQQEVDIAPWSTEAAHLIDNGVFLCGSMKSGTTMLLQLLDGHPDLVVLPGDSWFMGRIRNDYNGSKKEFWESHYNNWLTRLINPTGQAPFWLFGKSGSPYRDFLLYCRKWSEFYKDDEAGHVKSILLAHALAHSEEKRLGTFWIEKTPGNENEIAKILKYYPKARFIHIVRDPRENMASLKRLYTTRNWEWDVGGIARQLGDSSRLSQGNRDSLGDKRYHVLSYEDLTASVGDNMKRIAEFIGIPWNERLLTPTINGYPAQANTMYSDRRVKGKIRSAVNDKWKTVLSSSEKRAVLNILNDAQKAGYHWDLSMRDRILYILDRLNHKLRHFWK